MEPISPTNFHGSTWQAGNIYLGVAAEGKFYVARYGYGSVVTNIELPYGGVVFTLNLDATGKLVSVS